MGKANSNLRAWVIRGSIVSCVAGFLFFLPAFLPESGRVVAGKQFRISLNLQQIESAGQLWAVEHQVFGTRLASKDEIIAYLPGGWVKSVADEEYTINPLEHRAEATLRYPVGNWPKGTRIFLRPGGYTVLFPDGTSTQDTPNPY